LLLLVNGEGGIGKTTFASRYYHQYADEYAHVGWVFATARNYFQQAEALWAELTESAPGYIEFQQNLSNVRSILSELPQATWMGEM